MKTFPASDSENMINKMVSLGFRKVIISVTLGAPERLIDAMKKSCGQSDAGRGRLKNAVSLLATNSEKVEATNFMTIYLRVAKDPGKVVDISEIIMSFEIYQTMHRQFSMINRVPLHIDANAAWIMARDFRAEEIRMVTCVHCDNHFVSPYDDRIHKCPFCNGQS